MESYCNRAGNICTKAVAVVIEAGDLIHTVIYNSEVLFTKKSNCQGTKERSELRLTEISNISDKQFIRAIRNGKSRRSS